MAGTLETVAQKGRAGFYDGWVAEATDREMARHGGLITLDDLRRYRVRDRQPVRGSYRGYEAVSMPPSSSGGIHLVQMLNILEGYDLKKPGWR